MALTRNYVKICLHQIDNYLVEAETATTETDRQYWLRQAGAGRRSLQRRMKIETVLDQLFGPEGGEVTNGKAQGS